ncbi:MAG: maleate cis-trans isomerase family protein [Betaproteobacteria bacterium]
MTDSLGHRGKFGVLAPSTNTSVQPEFDAMRPWGITHHHSRLIIPDSRVTDDRSFLVMMDGIRAALFPALEAVLSCRPDYVVLGMSAETFWDGLLGSKELQRKLDKVAKCGVVMGSDACQAALRAYGKGIKRLGIITPYMPVGDRQVRRFFTECGFEVVNLLGLKCRSPVLIAHESRKRLRDAINQVNRGKVDAIVQVGTNLAMAEVAAMAEFWLDKPMIAINTATYWYALRQYGIKDRIQGWGSLLSEH